MQKKFSNLSWSRAQFAQGAEVVAEVQPEVRLDTAQHAWARLDLAGHRGNYA